MATMASTSAMNTRYPGVYFPAGDWHVLCKRPGIRDESAMPHARRTSHLPARFSMLILSRRVYQDTPNVDDSLARSYVFGLLVLAVMMENLDRPVETMPASRERMREQAMSDLCR